MLKRMSVRLADVGRESVRALAGALQDNKTLEHLKLYRGYCEFFSVIERSEMDPRISF